MRTHFVRKKIAKYISPQLVKILVAVNLLLFIITGFKSIESHSNSTFFSKENTLNLLELTKSVSNSTPLSGETFSYSLQYRCASITDNCTGTYISDPLPPEVEFISLVNSSHITSSSYNPSTHTVTFTFIDPLLSGTTGQVEIYVRFPNGNTGNGVTASNTAIINSTNAVQQSSNTVIATASAVDRTATEKYYQGGVLDNEMVFGIQVCNNDHQTAIVNGTISPSVITVRDTLPPTATFISTNGVYDPVSHSVEWTYPDTLGLGDCWWPQVFVQFSSADYNEGDGVSNTAYITYTPVGGSPVTRAESVTVWFTEPIAQGGLTKAVHNSTRVQGESNSYYIEYWNTSNIYIDDFYIEDIIPNGIIVDNFNTGNFFANGTYTSLLKTVKYTTNLNSTWTSTPSSPTDLWINEVITPAVLGLASNEYITGIRWEFGPDAMPYSSGFNSSEPLVINFHVDINAPLGNVTNCLTGGGADSTFLVQDASSNPNCATFEVLPGVSGYVPATRKDYKEKLCNCWTYFGNGHFFNPGDTIPFRLNIGNYNTSTTNIINPSIADFLPIGLTYVPGTWSMDDNGTGAPAPSFSIQDNYNGTGRELLTWEWSGFNLPPSDNLFVTFDAVLGLDAPVGEDVLINEYAMLQHDGNGCNSASGGYEKADTDDFDGDGNTTEQLCFSYAALDVGSVVSIESEMLIKGQLDSDWTKYPDAGSTVSGGVADYLLEIRNLGNVAVGNVVIIDILPFVGDQGVIDLNNRDSRWRPNLVSTVSAPMGVTVYYSTESNPCRSAEGLVPSGPAGCTAPNWTTSPSDLIAVQSLKFDFGSTTIEALDTFRMQWSMRAPVDVLPTIGAQPDSIAWNSFGYIAQRVDNGDMLLATEPIKVGMNVSNISPNVYGDFVWEDTNQNGIQNGGEPGIDGVRVELYKDNGDGIINPTIDTFINFTLTGNGGYYLFPNLDDGDFYSIFHKPPTMDITSNDSGGNDNTDSDGVGGTYNGFDVAIFPIVTLDNFANDLSWDLGLYPSSTGAVGDYVWNDVNGNGMQDEANSEGINGVTINLYNNSSPSSPVASVVTSNDANGNPGYYLFSGVTSGNYFLELSLPSGVTYTPQGTTGTSDPSDSDFNVTTNRTEVFAVTAGNYDNSWDAGLVLSGTEICDNGVDDDGDGNIDYLDTDCDCPTGYSNAFNINFGAGVAITGSGLNLGDQILYSNVGNIGNQSIDIRATVADLTNISSLDSHGNNNGGLILPSVRISTGTLFSATLQYEIFESGTTTPISGSFEIEIVDLDLADNNRREFVIVPQSEVNRYSLFNPTNINTSFTGGNISFSGTTNLTGADPEGAIKLTYTDINQFSITYMMEQMVAGSNAGKAGFGLNGDNIQFFTDCLDEICNDGIDNDADGLTDCDDFDCFFTTTINADETICIGTNTVLFAGGGDSYLWSTSETDSIIMINNLVNTTEYFVTITNAFGCTEVESVTISIENCGEVCFNGIDDDGDGDIDENDTDCEIDCSGVVAIDFATAKAEGAGVSGIPVLNYAPPSGNDRYLIFVVSLERDHMPLATGDNWGNQTYSYPVISFGGVNLNSAASQKYFTGTGSFDKSHAEVSIENYFYYLPESSIPSSGTFTVVSGLNAPLNDGDEMIFSVGVFENVDTIESHYTYSSNTSFTMDMSPINDQPSGSLESDNMLLAFTTMMTNSSVTPGATWTEVGENIVINSDGNFGTDPDRSVSDYTEDDGLSQHWQILTGVTGSQTATYTYSGGESPANRRIKGFRLISQGCIEICDDGIDNDGDGLIDCYDCESCASSTACSDNDGDGIGDFCDIDDDNDGILDVIECPDYSYGSELVINGDFEDAYANWTSDFNRGRNNNNETRGGCSIQGWVAVSPCATRNGDCSDYYGYHGGTYDGSILIIDPFGTGANILPTTNCNVTTHVCLPEVLPDHTTGTGFSLYVDPNDIPGQAYWKQVVTVEAGKNYEFSAWIMVIEEDPNLQFKINGVNLTAGFNLDRQTPGSNGPDVWQQFFANWYSGTTSGNVEIELVNLTAGCGGNDIRVDDISLREVIADCDCDGDGIINSFDLDSDNDGIYDLIEAGHAGIDANLDGVIDNANLNSGNNGLFDALETATESGILNYTVADSETSPDGILDICELDSDGDGCFDVEEESILDSDNDGVAGTGTPSVDGNGIITSISYVSPTNNTWQDPSTGSCLPEICDDGIDNDADGSIDCLDSDCTPIANPATLNTCDNSNMTGSGAFFLHDANPTITTESGMMISYHLTLSDAQNGINNLINPYTSSDGTVYVKVERISTGCYSTALITLNVGTKCVESCVNGIDDDGDGLIDCNDPDCPCCGSN